MEQTDSCKTVGGMGKWQKEGEEISQRTYMNDPWTWTMVWGLTELVRGRLSGGVQRGKKIGTTVIE